MNTRAVLYARLSVSREESTSIARQVADLEALAAREGWEVVTTLEDDGLSGGKRRDKADEALAMLHDGTADVLAVWKWDRWSRQGARAVADLQDVLDERPGALFVADRDSLRSDTPDWDLRVALIAAMGRSERETIRARVRSSREGLRKAGRFPGGVVPFGYSTAPREDGPGRTLVINPEEARLVREVADIVLDGGSAYAAMKHLQASGVKPRRAKHWSLSSVIALLTGDAALGRMSRAGQPVRGDDGVILQPFPAVLPLADVERLRALLAPKRAEPGQRKGARTSTARLLSGLLSCASCGARLRVSSSNGGKRYTCHGLADGAGCAAPVSIVAEPLDEHLAETYLDAVGWMPEVRREERLADVSGLAEVEEAITATASAMTAPDADVAALVERLQALRERREALASAPAEPQVVEVATGRTVAEAWEASTLDERRALLRSALDGRVVIRPGVRGRRGLDTARIAAPWRWLTS